MLLLQNLFDDQLTGRTRKIKMTLQKFSSRDLVPRARSWYGLDLVYYSTTVCKLNDLTREVFTVYEYLKLEEVRPLVDNVTFFWNRHYNTLKPLIECSAESGKKLLVDRKYRKKVLARALLNVPLVAVALQLALSLVFVYQCTQIWRIRVAIKEALRFLSEDEVKLELTRIDQNVEHMKDLSSDLVSLVDQYEKCRRNKKEANRLLEKMDTKLTIAKRFADTSEGIDNLQTKLLAQKTMLSQCDQRFIQTGLTSLSVSGIGLLTVLITDKLAEIDQNLAHLADDCQLNFTKVADMISQTEERKERLLEVKQREEEEEAKKAEGGMIASFVNVTGGLRQMASLYMNLLN